MTSNRLSLRLALVASFTGCAFDLKAGPEAHGDDLGHEEGAIEREVNWLTGEGVSLGGILLPHVHFRAAYGGSSGDQGSLAVSHHDPNRDGWTVQGFEFGASLRANEYL